MIIELKLIITLATFWLITHLLANPSSNFSNWGRKKFNDYSNFLVVIFTFYFIPITGIALYLLWTKC